MDRPDNVIYENSRGQTVLLDGSGVPWREVMGRTGCGVPPVQYTETVYANGVTEIMAVQSGGRDVTLMFWMEGFDESERRSAFHRLKLSLFEVGRRNSWGKLRLRCSDGRWVYLNCVYSGGLDGETETDARFQRFALDFHCADPLFYDTNERQSALNTSSGRGLRMRFRFGAGVRLRSSREAVFQQLFRMNAFMAYPEIDLTGPAQGIRFSNEANGKAIFFDEDFELKRGEKLAICTRPMYSFVRKTGTDGAVTDVSNLLAPGATLRWELVNGDNLVTLLMTGTGSETSCIFRYREGHLSLW